MVNCESESFSQVPGRSPFQMICYYTASKEAKRVISPTKGDSTCSTDEEQPTSEGWENCLRKFWEADQEYCDARFKIIPNVVSTVSYFFNFALATLSSVSVIILFSGVWTLVGTNGSW